MKAKQKWVSFPLYPFKDLFIYYVSIFTFNFWFSIYSLIIFYKLKMFQELKWRQLDHVSCWITVLEGLSAFNFYFFSIYFFIVMNLYLKQNVF